MQNQIKMHKKFETFLNFYTVGSEPGINTWIISYHIREDFGPHISISAPITIIQGKENVNEEVKNIFSSGGNVLNWDENMRFVALEKPVSKMIFDISVNVKGNVTEVHPNNLYCMEIVDALQLEIHTVVYRTPQLVEVRRLDAFKKEESFIFSNWKYAQPSSEQAIRRCVEMNASGGVFLEDKCVSGVITSGYGLLSALYTDKAHRQKGYGKVTMKFAFIECAKEECIPCLSVERRNLRSINFHEALGLKLVSEVDWIDIIKLDVD